MVLLVVSTDTHSSQAVVIRTNSPELFGEGRFDRCMVGLPFALNACISCATFVDVNGPLNWPSEVPCRDVV